MEPGAEAWDPHAPVEARVEAERRIGRLRGKEYGLYRYVVETKVYSGEAYHRALAAPVAYPLPRATVARDLTSGRQNRKNSPSVTLWSVSVLSGTIGEP